MLFLKRFLFLFTLIAGFVCSPAHAMEKRVEYDNPIDLQEIVVESDSPKENVYNSIAKESLKSLNSVSSEEIGLCSQMDDCEKNGFKAFIKNVLEQQLKPDADGKHRLILKILTDYFSKNQAPHSDIMDEITWQDLNILCGPKSDPKMHLLSKIIDGRTITTTGAATISRMLVQPTADFGKLLSQQKITKELIKNKKLFTELNSRLEELVIPENVLLSFWDSEDIFALILEQMKIKIPFDDKVEILKRVSDWINKSPPTRELYSRIEDIFGYIGKFFAAYGAVAIPVYALTGKSIIPKIPAEDLKVIAPYTMLGVVAWAAYKLFTQKTAGQTKSVLCGYNYAKHTYYEIRNLDESRVMYEMFHKKISLLAKYLSHLKEMANFVKEHPVLTDSMPAVKKFTQSIKNLKTKNDDFGKLIELLETSTFKGEYSWLSYFSRVLVAYKLMLEQKENFVPAMLAVGELDAQLTIAKLYKEFEKKPVKFCFPKYLTCDDSDGKPAIKATKFWNPFLDPKKAVPNSIEIGHKFGTPQGVVITGPNAAGKSTITKAIILSVILGQSLGIAPANSLTFTPASKIMTYLNITDDIASGNSHFQAGVIRARELLEASKNLNPGEFGLFALDEAFNGTTFDEGQVAAFTLIKKLGQNRMGICVTNTHFPMISTLEEKTGLFKNYKVSVIDEPGKNIIYTFTLEEGISRQNVALKILKEEGFGDEFIDEAQGLI
jgi:ABC-type multidrug transport system fused ATPase/permease subunit